MPKYWSLYKEQFSGQGNLLAESLIQDLRWEASGYIASARSGIREKVWNELDLFFVSESQRASGSFHTPPVLQNKQKPLTHCLYNLQPCFLPTVLSKESSHQVILTLMMVH